MTTQAKNKLLAAIVAVMLIIIAVASIWPKQPPKRVAYLPTTNPVFVTVSEADPYESNPEFQCLRSNIYFEAGDQSVRGMEATALVVLTRMKTKHFPAKACDVVKAYTVVKSGRKVCQFSWYCDGKADRPNLSLSLERKAWERADKVARKAMDGKLKDFLGGATHYHANYVNPKWANVPSRYKLVAVVGDHLFYRDIKLKLKA